MYQAHVRYLICKSIKTKKEIIESKDSVCVCAFRKWNKKINMVVVVAVETVKNRGREHKNRFSFSLSLCMSVLFVCLFLHSPA